MKTLGMVFAGALMVAAGAAHADSVSLSFYNITNNGNADLSGQLEVIVSDVAGDPDAVDFAFKNHVGIRSSISEVYFDDGNPAGSLFDAWLHSQTGASFVFGEAAPGDLPGGNSLADPFEVSVGFLADSQGNPSLGIDAEADELVVRGALHDGMGFGDVVARLEAGLLRIGMHIRAIDPQGGSDSYVNGDNPPPPVVPLPGTAAMGLAGLGALASRRRR